MKKLHIVLLIIFLILVSIYVSYTLYDEVANQSILDQYHKNEIYARQAVISIENFFQNFSNSLNFLSTKDEIIYFDEDSKSLLKNYLETYTDQLKAITRVSAEGKIIYTYPYIKSVIGEDISKQEHNAEILRTNEPVISDVITTVQGYSAIIFAYPVFKNSKYDGSISLVIPFDYIADKFLKSIKIGKTGTSFLVSEAGYELYCDHKEHIGKSIFENIEGYPQLQNMVKKMLLKKKGRDKYSYKSLNGNDSIDKIAVYEPIILENTFWSIAVIMAEDEVLKANTGFITKFLIFLMIIAIVIALILYFMAKQRQKSRELIQEKELKYKENLEKLVEVRTDELKRLNESLKHDILKRKEVESDLKKAVEKVEKSEKIKSEFLAQMSHEIRTPINTILSFSTLIKDELSKYASEELNYGFKGIESAGKRLIRTIDLILNMSDVQLGTHEYIPKKTDIYNEVIKNLLIEYRNQISEKNLKIETDIKTDDLVITVDSYSVNQIFANLIDNAIKYTEEGSIIIEINRNSNGDLYVAIIDTGIGIVSEYLPNIFNEFTQEDRGYTRKFEGNGLGLALVKKYCELNNARITVESEKGKGSIFTVTFLNAKK